MLDISIDNIEKIINTSDKEIQFLQQSLVIEEKLDGTKLNVIRNNNDFDFDDFINNFIISYKKTILYPEEHDYLEHSKIKRESIGNAQYKLVMDHFKKINPHLNKLPKNTEFFIEFLMNKPTLTRDYKDKHHMVLLGYSDTTYTEKNGIVESEPLSFEIDRNQEFADLLDIDTPNIILSGKIFPYYRLEQSILDKKFYDIVRQHTFTNDKHQFITEFKKCLLELESKYGGKSEGVVIRYNDTILKVVQSDQYDKETRFKKKLIHQMDPDDENKYFLELKQIGKELIKDNKLDYRKKLKELANTIYNGKVTLPLHTKKTILQVSEDLFHVCKYLLIKSLPGNNVALFIGRLQPPTKLHFEIIRQGLNDFDDVVVAIVKGTKSERILNPFDFELQSEMLHEEFPDLKIIQSNTGNIISIMNKMNINVVLCGSDRVESYRNQLKNNPEIAVIETKRDEDVSGTNLRNALKTKNKSEFKRNTDPSSYKFFDILVKEINEKVKSFDKFLKL